MKQLLAVAFVVGSMVTGCSVSTRTSLPRDPTSGGGTSTGNPDERKPDGSLPDGDCASLKADGPCAPGR